MKSLFLFLIGTILLFACQATSQNNSTNKQEYIPVETIDKAALEFLQDSLWTSLSVGVFYKGEELTRHYGELDRGLNNKPTDKTMYEIGSVSKTLLGTLIAQAEIEGKLTLDDDVRKYLDGEYPNLQYRDHPIKIKHLLTHTNGLPRWLPVAINDEFENRSDDLAFRIVTRQKNYSKNQFLEDLKKVSIDTLPGTRFEYTNSCSELAAHILEKAYNKPFGEILKIKLCDKLDMPNTTMDLTPKQLNMLANGYASNGQLAPHSGTQLWGPSGAGKSTVHDLMNYMKFQLNSDDPLARQTHKVLYDKEVIYGDERNKIGYFWILGGDRVFGQFISHHGGAHGTNTWVLLYPEIDLGITVISNQGAWQTSGRLRNVSDAILDELEEQ